MTAARLAARCLALLGPPAGPVAIHAPAHPRLAGALAARVPAARDGTPPAAAVVVFYGEPAAADARQLLLSTIHATLPCGAPVVVVDHNQPRTLARRALAALTLALTGTPPSRARYPAARELLAAGFPVARLHLAAGERLQLILTHRR